MPLGNGDVSASIWVERDTGDMLLYLAKSDAFDINALPIKVGRLRLAFMPPLWRKGTTEPGWSQRLTPSDGSVVISAAGGYAVRVTVDANAPVLRVVASHPAGFKLEPRLELYHHDSNWQRNVSRPYTALSTIGEFNASAPGNPTAFGSYCLMPFLEPDTVVPAAELATELLQDSVVWFHRNEDTMATHGRPTYYQNVMKSHGLDPDAFPDPLLHRTFGAAMGGAGFVRAPGPDGNTMLSATMAPGARSVLEVALHTEESAGSPAAWIAGLGNAVHVEAARGTLAAKEAAHNATWLELWSRSFIDVSLPAGSGPDGSDDDHADLGNPDNVEAVNDAYVWQRYLDLADGTLYLQLHNTCHHASAAIEWTLPIVPRLLISPSRVATMVLAVSALQVGTPGG